MKVRAKFRVHSKADKTVKLHPVYSGSEENKEFFAATPGGEVALFTLNDKALAEFEVGREFYVDFTPADG